MDEQKQHEELEKGITEQMNPVLEKSQKVVAGSTAKMNTGSSTKFMTGLAAGVAIGAAVALLYAPQSGKETRRMVKEKASAIKKGASKIINDAAVKEKALAIKEKVSNVLSEINRPAAPSRKVQDKKARKR